MSYGYLIKKPYFDFGFPTTKDGDRAHYNENYFDTVFRKLLVYDQGFDDNWEHVIDEAGLILNNEDQAFSSAISAEYLAFLRANSYLGKWQKIKQDNNFLIKKEEQRRNKENPYHNLRPKEFGSWEKLPEADKAYKNRPWQFELIYKDINYFCLKILSFLKDLEKGHTEDRDIIRVRINSILAAEKIIYALDSIGNRGDYLEGATNIIDIKLGLDGLKSSEVFLDRVIESLHKIKWYFEDQSAVSEPTSSFIAFASQISDALRKRIKDNERRLVMFMNMEKDSF